MKTIGNIRKLFLLLALIVAGVQSAWARVDNWKNNHADVTNVSVGGVTYEVCHTYVGKGIFTTEYGYGYYETEYDYPTSERYYASVVGITGSGAITIPDSITNGGRKYPVTYVGLHTEQSVITEDITFTYYIGMTPYTETATCYHYSYTQTPVSISSNDVTKLTVNANVEFKGSCSLPACSSVEFNKDVTFSANVYFDRLTSVDVVFNDYVTINEGATLSCFNASTLKFNGLTHKGKIRGSSKLTDIYYQSNLPEYSGSFSNYFTNVSGSQITAHVANKTAAECQTIQSSWAVYNEFAAVVPYTVTNPKYTVQVKIENARAQITYTNNGNTYTLTCEANRNITVDGSSDLIIRPYKTYDNLRLASVTLNGAEIIGDLTGTGTMYDAYTISDINSDVYLAFTGEEKVDVTVKVEASAPQSHFITNSFWVRPNYGQSDNLYANQSATFTMSKYGRFFFEMEEGEDETWGITWQVAAIYVNGKDRTADITYDMTTWFELECITGDTEIRVVFEPNCDFVRVMSLDGDLLWTRFDGDERLIDCAEGDNYYVPVIKNGEGVVVRTDLIGQSPADYNVIYWKNNGRYDIGQASMDQGGVELTPDGKNFQFKLLPGVKDQDRIIGIYPKATGMVETTEWTVVKTAEVEDAEVRVSVEGGEEETTALTDACTEIDVSNAEYAQLRVKGSVSSSTYDLYLNAYDIANHKIDVIRVVREITGLGLVEAKALVESAPVKVKGFATRAEAEAAMATQTAIEGTQCSVKSPGVGTFVKVLRNGVDVTADMTPDGDYLMMNVDAADLTSTTWVITTEELINRFDTNNDGKVDISDVTKLVNEVLNK